MRAWLRTMLSAAYDSGVQDWREGNTIDPQADGMIDRELVELSPGHPAYDWLWDLMVDGGRALVDAQGPIPPPPARDVTREVLDAALHRLKDGA